MFPREGSGGGWAVHGAISITHVLWRLPWVFAPYSSGLCMAGTEWGDLGTPSLSKGEAQGGRERGLVPGQEWVEPTAPPLAEVRGGPGDI